MAHDTDHDPARSPRRRHDAARRPRGGPAGHDPEALHAQISTPTRPCSPSRCRARTEGRYQIEQIIGFDRLEAALGKERAVGGERPLLEGVRSGDLDLVIVAPPLGDYVPEADVFYVPFLFRDYAHARAVLDGPIGQDILGKLPAHGLVGLAWTEAGFRHLANSKRPIRSPEDLKGLKLRTPKNPVVDRSLPHPRRGGRADALARRSSTRWRKAPSMAWRPTSTRS